MSLNSPMAQIYINSKEIDTKFCINNFYNFLCPEIKDISFECRVGFTNKKGIMILKKFFDLKEKKSIYLSIKDTLKENNIESFSGLVMSNIYPIGNEEKKNEIFNKMGKTTSFFYNFYEGLECDSISLVHPQSVIDGKKYSGPSWRSNQIINTENLKKIRIWQANHSDTNEEILYNFFDAKTNSTLEEKSIIVNAFGTNYVDFDNFNKSNWIGIELNKLPCGNGKPLIMRYFKNNGGFNISHA